MGKKLFNLGLAFVMSVSVLCAPALAVSSDSTATGEKPKISEEYASDPSRRNGDDLVGEISRFISDIVVPFGNAYVLNECDEVQLGMAIPTYVIDGNLNGQKYYNAAEVQYYPVFSEGSVIGLVGVAQDDGGDYIFSYSEGYSAQINNVLADNAEIALVGDGKSLEAVAGSGQTKSACAEFSVANPAEELFTINISTSAEKASKSSSGPVLSVPAKYQSKDWDCWAACAACVGQYYTGIDLSSTDVANAVGIQTYATADQTRDAIWSVYHVNTVCQTGALNASGVLHTISNDRRPILAGMFCAGLAGHMVVINGWTLVGSNIALTYMDPKAGPTMATLSNNSPYDPVAFPLGGYMYTMRDYII